MGPGQVVLDPCVRCFARLASCCQAAAKQHRKGQRLYHHDGCMALCSVLLASATASPTAATSRLVGIVSGAPAGSLVRVRAYQVPADGIGITKEDVYLDLDATGTTATARPVNASRTDAAADGTFAIPLSSSSLYTFSHGLT